MPYKYNFEINLYFTIEVEHLLTKDYIKNEGNGSVYIAFESYSEELRNELSEDYEIFNDNELSGQISHTLSVTEHPQRRNSKNKYKYSFHATFIRSFDEKHVVSYENEGYGFEESVLLDDLLEDIISENEMKEELELMGYTVINLAIDDKPYNCVNKYKI